MQSSGPVVWMGLDALDLAEVRLRLADGRMPHLARIAAVGALQTLGPDVPGFAGAIWRSFVNGCSVDGHGWHFGKVWRPEIGSLDAASPDFLRLRPFWSELSRAGLRLGLVDVPYAPDPGEGFDGVFLTGWQTHDSHPLTARPRTLLATLEHRFGRPMLPDEIYGAQRPAGLLRLHGAAIRSIGQIADIGAHLLQNDRFDLFMLVIGASHRAGHYLWDLSQIDQAGLPAAEAAQLRAAMDDVYAACDAAVGRLCAASPAGARIGVFALHGMGPNPGWTDVFPDILRQMAHGAEVRPGLRDRLYGWRRSSAALSAVRLVPAGAQRWLRRAWSPRMHDWSTTRYFAVPREDGGALRINLAGREPAGIVAPGAECADLCAELTQRLAAVEDLETGQPIVVHAHIVDELVDPAAPYRNYLPDIVLEWGERRLGESVGVRIPDGGEIRWPRGRRLTSGRSGNHRPWGWIAGEPSLTGCPARQRSAVDLTRALVEQLRPKPARHGQAFGLGLWLNDAFGWAGPMMLGI